MKNFLAFAVVAGCLIALPLKAEENGILPVDDVLSGADDMPVAEETAVEQTMLEETAEPRPGAGNDVVQIKGTACEKFVTGQPKSSTRVKVTDKACYLAVSRLESLAGLKAKIPDYDYNVIVYDLVDNHVQDLTVRTVNQNSRELCVEISGTIPAADIVNLIANQVSAEQGEAEYDFQAENDIAEEKIDIAAEAKAEEAKAEPEAEVLYEGEPKPSPEEADAAAIAEEKALIYVAPTWFFDGTQSSKLSEVLKEMFSNTELYQLTEDEAAADYAFYPNVNKAKVDSINSQTKRMQMVVSVELKSKGAALSSTEHQNRFVLYEVGEDEQTVAQTLLKKLLKKAGGKLFERVEKVEQKRQDKILPPIITPVATL